MEQRRCACLSKSVFNNQRKLKIFQLSPCQIRSGVIKIYMSEYSQLRAMLAITKASLRSVFRSPSAVVFSFAFPLVFILVFGFISEGNRISVRIALQEGTDTLNPVYRAIQGQQGIHIVRLQEKAALEDLEKGRIAAILNIQKNDDTSSAPYRILIKTSEAVNPQHLQVLQHLLNSVIDGINKKIFPINGILNAGGN